jgi:hypothetical protein
MRLTIRKFQELYEIAQMETDELTKSSLLVQCYTNKTEEKIDAMSPKEFSKLCLEVSNSFDILKKKWDDEKPQQRIKVNGRWYFLNFDLKKQTAARYVEVATFGNDIVNNLHKIMATMANPMKLTWKGLRLIEYKGEDHERISKDMLDIDFSIAYHSALFFYALFTKSIKNLQDYLKVEEKATKEQAQAVADFIKLSDGFITAKWYQNLKV